MRSASNYVASASSGVKQESKAKIRALSETQAKLLSSLEEAGRMRQVDLVRLLPERRRQTIAEALDKLERLGYIAAIRWQMHTYYYVLHDLNNTKAVKSNGDTKNLEKNSKPQRARIELSRTRHGGESNVKNTIN